MQKTVYGLLLMTLLVSVDTYAANGDFQGSAGHGTQVSPWLVEDCLDLQNIDPNNEYKIVIDAVSAGFNPSNTLEDYYRLAPLVGDVIDCSETDGSGLWTTSGFDPIGSDESFVGELDGNNKIIKNMVINRPSEDYAALLERNDGVVKDVVIESADIAGYGYVGCIIGEGLSDIDNLSCEGQISGEEYVGGVVGSQDAHITNTSFSGEVIGSIEVGGIVGSFGYYEPSNIESIKVEGKITGQDHVGGIAGRASGIIDTAKFIGQVEGVDTIGGIAGFAEGQSSKLVASGSVVGDDQSGEYAGGLFGAKYGEVSESYFVGTVEGYDKVGGLIGQASSNIYAMTAKVSDVFAQANVKGNTHIGGLVGLLEGELENGYVIGNIEVSSMMPIAGGLVGEIAATNIAAIENNYFAGDVVAANGIVSNVGWDFGKAITIFTENNYVKTDDQSCTIQGSNCGSTYSAFTGSGTMDISNENWLGIYMPQWDTSELGQWEYQSGVNNGLPLLSWNTDFTGLSVEQKSVNEVVSEMQISTPEVVIALTSAQESNMVEALEQVTKDALDGLSHQEIEEKVEQSVDGIFQVAKQVKDHSNKKNNDLAKAKIIMTGIENLTEIVDDEVSERVIEDPKNKVKITAKKIDHTRQVIVESKSSDITISNIPEGNTLVIATAEKNSEMPKPAGLIGDVMIIEMKDKNGYEVAEGFSVDIEIEKVTTQIPTLVRLNEETGKYEEVSGVIVADGGATWNMTLTSFSTYALKGETNKIEDAFNDATNSKVKKALEYSNRLADNVKSELQNTKNNSRSVNQVRTAVRAAEKAGEDGSLILDAVTDITGRSASSANDAYSSIREWKSENKYR